MFSVISGATVVARTDPQTLLLNRQDRLSDANGIYVSAIERVKQLLRHRKDNICADPTRQRTWHIVTKSLARAARRNLLALGKPHCRAHRSAPLDLWGNLTQAPCRFISLQYGEVGRIYRIKKTARVDIHVDGKVNPLKNANDWFAQIGTMDLVFDIQRYRFPAPGADLDT